MKLLSAIAIRATIILARTKHCSADSPPEIEQGGNKENYQKRFFQNSFQFWVYGYELRVAGFN